MCDAPFLAGVVGWVACSVVVLIWLLWEGARAPIIDDEG